MRLWSLHGYDNNNVVDYLLRELFVVKGIEYLTGGRCIRLEFYLTRIAIEDNDESAW